jgi:hypothetical protein
VILLRLVVLAAVISRTLLPIQTGRGPYARIAVLRPHDGHTIDFEAGYVRHLDWHRQARDAWVWYGWTIWAGERQRWFVYASFGHSAASLDSPVAPADDERDNILNVTPHAEFVSNSLYEYLPDLSRGTGEPQSTARLEFTTLELLPGRPISVTPGDALVSNDGGWIRATLCPPPSAAKPFGDSRRDRGANAPR